MLANPLPTINRSVIVQELDAGGVLYNPSSQIYFSVNPTGLEICRFLEEGGARLADLVSHLAETFPSAPESEIRADALGFLRSLDESGLLEHPAQGEDLT